MAFVMQEVDALAVLLTDGGVGAEERSGGGSDIVSFVEKDKATTTRVI